MAQLVGVHTISRNYQISLMLYYIYCDPLQGIKQAVIVGLNFNQNL